jgi:hypothetical protein
VLDDLDKKAFKRGRLADLDEVKSGNPGVVFVIEVSVVFKEVLGVLD